MNPNELEALDQELRTLSEEVPPMPDDFHAGWMKQVEKEAAQKKLRPTPWNRILSTAAALIFVVGGTLMTRDTLSPTPNSSNGTEKASYGTMVGYGMRSASNSEAYADVYDSDTMVTMASGEAASAQEQKVIRTASLTITTQQFDESLTALKQLCQEQGGWIAYSSESSSADRRTASLTLRIPSSGLDTFLTGLGDTGRITHRSESADDVTESYYDTKARLETQQALMARLQALITDAASLSDLLALESQIADTQYQIDRLQASLNSTDRQVSYATVDVSLREEIPSDSLTDAQRTLPQRLWDGIRTGWETFTGFLSDAAVFVAAALPFLFVVALFAVAFRLLRKRK